MSIVNAIQAGSSTTLCCGAGYALIFAIGRVLATNIRVPAGTPLNTTISRSTLVAGAIFGIGAGLLESIIKVPPNNVKMVTIIGSSILATMALISILHFSVTTPSLVAGLFGTFIYGCKLYTSISFPKR